MNEAPLIYALLDLPRWTWRGLVGLVFVVLAYVLPRFVALPETASDVVDHANLIGLILLGAEVARARKETPPGNGAPPSAPTRTAPDLMRPLRFLAVAALLVAIPACGTFELRGKESVTFQRRPGATCYMRVLVDADKWVEVEAPFACVPPPEFCQPGPGEPGYPP